MSKTFAALLAGVSTLAMSGAALAQTAKPAVANDLTEVVVTGTRIVANGYQAPTPVTVMSPLELARSAPESIPAGLSKLPQFAATAGATVTSAQAGTPSAGNYLNLRRLGSIENLVLLNGQRLPPTSFDGTVDTNIIPQALIKRVEVVTGGASAAYGSDAVSGVINFILDTKFDGLKGLVQTGISKYGDDPQFRAYLAGGAPFAGGRGHVEFSVDHFRQPGIKNNGERPNGANLQGGWVETGNGSAANPFTPTNNVRFGNATYGTLINAAQFNTGFSLRNYEFLPDGSVVPLTLGTPTGTTNFVVGGSGGVAYGATLTSALTTDQLFARVDYEIVPGVNAFAQLSFAESQNSYITVAAGTQIAAFQIYRDNAFLSDFVRNRMIADNINSFTASRIEADQTPKRAVTKNDVYTFLSGVEGKFGDYNWNVTYSHGDSLLRTAHSGNFINQRWYAALDAVRGPQGNIVCRITITNPGLQDGCVPWNPFGNGSPSKASYDYIQGFSQYQVRNKQDDLAGQISGRVFDLPAGPVQVAVGAEYRHQSLLEQSNTNPGKPIDLTGLRTQVSPFVLTFNSTNVGSADGSQTVKEAFAEVSVPLLKDAPFAKSLELNAAGRYTDYSLSGGVETYKVGLTWSPIEELRFRGAISRDIRAPTLFELFAGTSATRGTFFDIHTNGNQNTINLSHGNLDLKPEIGKTKTLGVIWQPAYVPGFSASIDYFNITISGAITRLSNTDINQQCETSNGVAEICQFINRPLPFADRSLNNFPTSTTAIPFNQASLKTRGIDYEVNYRLPLDRFIDSSDAAMNLRLVGNYTPHYTTQSGPAAKPIENAGLVTVLPKVKYNVSVDYTDGPLHLGAEARYLGKVVRTTTPNVFYTDNKISATTYVDASVSYDLTIGGRTVVAFANVNNLFNKIKFVAQTGQPTEFYPSVQSLYDVVGRYYTGGVRFSF